MNCFCGGVMQSDQGVNEIYNAVIAQKYIVAMFANIGHGYYIPSLKGRLCRICQFAYLIARAAICISA